MTCLDHWFDVDECKWWQFFIKEHNFILIDFLMFVFFRHEDIGTDLHISVSDVDPQGRAHVKTGFR
jgi:hypothetical protein